MGCGQCATVAHTGGEQESLKAKARLEAEGYEVTGWAVGEVACHSGRHEARDAASTSATSTRADAVLVLTCGAGVQTVADAVDKPVFPGLESRVPRQRGAPRRLRGALPDVRRLRARPDRGHLPGHDLPEGPAQRPVRRHVGRQVRGADATASARTCASSTRLAEQGRSAAEHRAAEGLLGEAQARLASTSAASAASEAQGR